MTDRRPPGGDPSFFGRPVRALCRSFCTCVLPGTEQDATAGAAQAWPSAESGPKTGLNRGRPANGTPPDFML